MSVVVVPCLSVERAHVTEAWRSLVGQGYDKDRLKQSVVADALWIARALPIVLDVLASLDQNELRLDAAIVETLAPAPARAPLSLIGYRRDDELLVEVLIVPSQALLDGSVVDSVLVRIAFPFRLIRLATEDDITSEDFKIAPVAVRRFSVGKTKP